MIFIIRLENNISNISISIIIIIIIYKFEYI